MMNMIFNKLYYIYNIYIYLFSLRPKEIAEKRILSVQIDRCKETEPAAKPVHPAASVSMGKSSDAEVPSAREGERILNVVTTDGQEEKRKTAEGSDEIEWSDVNLSDISESETASEHATRKTRHYG